MMASERFKPVQRIADSRERKAAAALGDSLKARHDAEQRLADLRTYHGEYLERLRLANQQGMNVAQVREYQAFLDKLEYAITEQERIVRLAADACVEAQAEWRDKYTRTRVMNKVVERMQVEERQQADKREQAQQDDRPQRKPQ
jgi:flagellar FliJ protein